jgi:hypothetical protein
MRPAGLVVSTDSVRLRKPAPRAWSFHDEEQIAERPREAVELPHDDNIALAKLLEHALQFGPVTASV